MKREHYIPLKYKRRQRIAILILIILIIVLAALVNVIVKSVLGAVQPVMADPGPCTVEYMKLMFNRYQNENFTTHNGLKFYHQDGELRSRIGIDVSYAQKEIDWKKVKEDGIDFAMIRLGFRGYESGWLNLDEYFHKNISGAQAAGIETGVYFYSQAISEKEAEEEADFVLEQIKNYRITYPVAYDWEVVSGSEARTDNISSDTLNNCALAFCRKVEESGYKPVVYASLNLLRSQFDKYDIHTISEYDLWLAEYKDYPEYPYYFRMWQYTDEGKISGIDYPTDINVYFEINPSTH